MELQQSHAGLQHATDKVVDGWVFRTRRLRKAVNVFISVQNFLITDWFGPNNVSKYTGTMQRIILSRQQSGIDAESFRIFQNMDLLKSAGNSRGYSVRNVTAKIGSYKWLLSDILQIVRKELGFR